MIIKIEISDNRIEVIGCINDNNNLRKVYNLTKIDNSWEVSLATMPSGNVDKSKEILKVCLECHTFKEMIEYGGITNSFVYYG